MSWSFPNPALRGIPSAYYVVELSRGPDGARVSVKRELYVAKKHFTRFVCQRILKSKDWLKSAHCSIETSKERFLFLIGWRWLRWRGRGNNFLFVRGVGLNSAYGVLQHQTLAVEACFVKRTLAELVRLHGTCTIVDSAPAMTQRWGNRPAFL